MSCILVVDDAKEIRAMLRRALESAGYRVDTVATGTAALIACSNRPYDLVVLDLVLPDLDGLEVLDRLLDFAPSSRVVVMSAQVLIDRRVRALQNGAIDFLPKPFAVEELLARLRLRLRTTPSGDAAPLAAPLDAAVHAVGIALDQLRCEPGSPEVSAVLEVARVALTRASGPVEPALRRLVAEIEACHSAGLATSPGLEAGFRAAVLAIAQGQRSR